MKKRYILLFIFLFFITIKTNNKEVISFNSINKYEYKEIKDISYKESLDSFANPERGFYRTAFLNMKQTGTTETTSGANLVHLRVNIGDFSEANNGEEDKEITDSALECLDKSLKNIKNNGGSVIIRFAYDGFNGHANVEPNLDMILRHIEQLGEVINNNKEVIAYVECGLFGPWGEMHTSTISSTDNVSKVIDKWLDTLDESIKIGVRTPRYFAAWANIDLNDIDTKSYTEDDKEYRVGLFNDGYLGSESDLGTFANREKALIWLKKQATHTFYGGEVVANFASGTPLNTVDYMSKEAFKTHTTYLNSEWNNTVINNWKDETYTGSDDLYYGKDGYLYINNHLGYRYVIRKLQIDDEIYESDKLNIKLNVENIGFANMINSKKVTLLFVNDNKVIEQTTDVDVTKWLSNETTEEKINIILPDEVKEGKWKVYLRISKEGNIKEDNNYQCVRIANEDIWDSNLGANYIGEIEVKESKSYTLNYYLDNKKMKNFTKEVKGNIDTIKENNKINIDDYTFVKVVVKDNTINYYYKSNIKNPNTANRLLILLLIITISILVIKGFKLLKIQRYN